MTLPPATPQRICTFCGAAESIGAEEPAWPVGRRCAACGFAVGSQDGIPLFAPELNETATGYDPALFSVLARVDASHFWFVARNELIVGLCDRYFPAAKSFLEIGCGTGAVLRALSAARPWARLAGSDLHSTGLAIARRRLPAAVELVQMNAQAIPAVAAFDVIGAFDVLEHIVDDEAALRSLRDAAGRDGGVILAVPQHPWLWSRADEIGHHQRRYRRGELETKLGRNGFEVMFSTSFTAVLLPLMMASRLLSRSTGGDAGIQREFAISGRRNAVLTSLLRAEVRLTLAGVHWPAGGSRVVVARAI
jgi:SAM-dependent methyltransferase